MKKIFLQSYKVQCRTKIELKTTNQIPKSPLRMSSLVVVHCTCRLRRRTYNLHLSAINRKKLQKYAMRLFLVLWPRMDCLSDSLFSILSGYTFNISFLNMIHNPEND